jgi:cell shape-determining protein MreD
MRWPVLAVFGFLLIAVQLSLRNALTLHSLWSISPDVVAPLAVFIALFAQRSTVLWACWLLGLVVDLAPQSAASPYHILGVNALAYTGGGYLILQLRTTVFRRRALTVGFLTVLFLVTASLISVTLLMVRSWYPGELPFRPLVEFALGLMISLYSGIVAIPLGWLLHLTFPLWGFQHRGSNW